MRCTGSGMAMTGGSAAGICVARDCRTVEWNGGKNSNVEAGLLLWVRVLQGPATKRHTSILSVVQVGAASPWLFR